MLFLVARVFCSLSVCNLLFVVIAFLCCCVCVCLLGVVIDCCFFSVVV